MATQILMPALSPTMTEGTLAKWLKKEGDMVKSGDVIAEIETDKATMEFEAVDEGKLGKIIVPEGTEGVAVNSPIAVLLDEGEDASAADAIAKSAPKAASAAKPEAPKAPEAPKPAAAPTAPAPKPTAAPTASNGGGRVFASPLAKRLAKEQGIDIAAVKGSGPHGRVVKADLANAPKGGLPAAAKAPGAPAARPPVGKPIAVGGAEGTYTDVPLSQMRKVIAQRLTESSQQIPHFFLTVDCEIDALLKLREDLNARAPKDGAGAYKLSVNDFVIRAVALAMRKVPDVNVSWAENSIRHWHSIDISVAVATEGGLITPIVRNADNKGLAQISNEMKDLSARAKSNKLKLEEFQGGGFSISNLGMFGVKEFSAIINPPQSCILAVGAGEKRPVVKNGALAIATVMSCTISTDHRTVDGALAAQYMAAFKALIEEPLTMLL